MKRKRNYQSGMTLIELMFAVGVVAMALSIIFGALVSISVMGRLNVGRTEAAASLSSILEEINTLTFDDVLNYVPPEINGPGKAFEVALEAVVPAEGMGDGGEESEQATGTEAARVSLPLPEGFEVSSLPDPVEIAVTITWQDDRGYVFRSVASTMKER